MGTAGEQSGRPPRPVSTRGGVGGIEAEYDDMVATARLHGAAAEELGALALRLQGHLVSPGQLAGAAIDPIGQGEFTAELAWALDGPTGLAGLALWCAGCDAGLRAGALGYRVGDWVASDPIVAGIGALPAAAWHGGESFATTGRPDRAMQRFVTSDPAIADLTVGRAVHRAGRRLPALLRDGTPSVADLDSDPASQTHLPPRSLHDVIAGLALRDRARPGAIDVRILTRPGGARAVIVDIPGTKSWNPLPNHDVTSVATDVHAMAGEQTAYEQGILAAMDRAGVRPTDDVMLVGHSEGGIVAMRAATDSLATGRFHVTHVVTAGAPIGRLVGRLPRSVQVLAIENDGDLVPHLDGVANPDRTNVVTATVHENTGSIFGNHHLDGPYLAGAADLDATPDPSVRAFLAGAGAFLDAEAVDTRRFTITRS